MSTFGGGPGFEADIAVMCFFAGASKRSVKTRKRVRPRGEDGPKCGKGRNAYTIPRT
jgi:hypothetical protein